MDGWMIYGANGYAGRLIAEEAVRRGWKPVLAGRSRANLSRLGQRLDLPVRVFALDTPNGIATHLAGVTVVLHCAGPLPDSSLTMLEGCMRAGVHYLDLNGGMPLLQAMLDEMPVKVRTAGIVAVPGVGMEVAPTDCLAALLHERLPEATSLRMGIRFEGGAVSRATAMVFAGSMATGGWIREKGTLRSVPILQECLRLPFSALSSPAVSVPWGDLVSAFHTTGIPDIRVYLGLPFLVAGRVPWLKYARRLHSLVNYPMVHGVIQHQLERHMRDPVPSLQRRGRVTIWGQVEGPGRTAAAMRIKAPDGYTLAVACALDAIRRLSERPGRPGVYTPSQAFGSGFVSELPGVAVEDVEPAVLKTCGEDGASAVSLPP